MYSDMLCVREEKVRGRARIEWNNGTTTVSYAHDQSTGSHEVPICSGGALTLSSGSACAFVGLRFFAAFEIQCLVSAVEQVNRQRNKPLRSSLSRGRGRFAFFLGVNLSCDWEVLLSQVRMILPDGSVNERRDSGSGTGTMSPLINP
jgi:hypothetical protein